MTEVKHTELPWRVEEDTDLIWGACNADDQTSYGMGYPIASGFSSFGTWAKGRPEFPEKEANAAFIVRACNSHYDLLDILREATLALDGFAKGEGVSKPIEQTIKTAHAIISKAEART